MLQYDEISRSFSTKFYQTSFEIILLYDNILSIVFCLQQINCIQNVCKGQNHIKQNFFGKKVTVFRCFFSENVPNLEKKPTFFAVFFRNNFFPLYKIIICSFNYKDYVITILKWVYLSKSVKYQSFYTQLYIFYPQ